MNRPTGRYKVFRAEQRQGLLGHSVKQGKPSCKLNLLALEPYQTQYSKLYTQLSDSGLLAESVT